jgi:hypothetical protein
VLSPRGNEDRNADRCYNHDASPDYKSYSEEQFLKLAYLTDRVFRGPVESDNNRAKLYIGAKSMPRVRPGEVFLMNDVRYTGHIPTSQKT